MHKTIAAVAFLLFNVNAFGQVPSGDDIFADGFEGFPWFQDADGDTYGNPLVVAHEYTQPAGYVADHTDCDDTNAAIHPGAADEPDGQFVDSNCDGLDGDPAKAVFVSNAGADLVTCGTQASPCQTIAYAVQFTTPVRPDIFIQQGTYNQSSIITRDARLYGGFDLQWHRGPVVPAGLNTVLIGVETPFPIIGTQAITLYVSNAQVTLDDIVIVGPDATAQKSSYAIYGATGATVTLDRDELVQGSGATGATGGPGADALVLTVLASQNGGGGGNGNQTSVFCDSTSRGSAGPQGANICAGSPSSRSAAGGAGGAGGTMDASCGVPSNFTATPGLGGNNASYSSSPSGLGGFGGAGSTSCGGGGGGNAGFVADGSGGAVGIGNSIIGGLWESAAGGNGQTGENGGGGGGGGGSGGCDTGTDSWGGGGGGGAAGGCAAQSGGIGGGGGGGSFGLFLVNANAVVSQTTFKLGIGGTGGAGGPGGAGQPGGAGGLGGTHPNSGSPGKGGDGARGGASGAGGGGQGGSVYGIYLVQSVVTDTNNQYVPGVAGAGGPGGPAPATGGEAGGTGADGALGSVGSCSTLSGCM